ncbi:hypothetical protein Tco_0299212 [Tanacetum coccineum]
MQKESVSKHGRKLAKSEPTVHKDPAFDDLDDVDVNDAMDYIETDAYMQKGVSTKDQVSIIKLDKGTDKPKVSTDKPKVSTDKPKEVEVSTDKLDEGTAEPKDGTSDKYDSDNCKKVLELVKKVFSESDVESKELMKQKESFDHLLRIRNSQKGPRWIGKQTARIKADRLLAARLQEEERETFTVKERAKFLYDTIVAQHGRFLLNKELLNQKQTTNKNSAKKPNDDLSKAYRLRMNEESKDPKKKRVVNETQGRKTQQSQDTANDDSDDEHRKKSKGIVTFDSTLDRLRIMETYLFFYLHKVSSPDGDDLVVYRANGNFRNCCKESELGLEVEEESTIALHLVRFIKQQLNEEYAVNGSEEVWVLANTTTTNGFQFNMSNRHQELTSPEANNFCEELASPGSNSSCVAVVLLRRYVADKNG